MLKGSFYCYFYYLFFFFCPATKGDGIYGKKDGANQRSRGGEHLTVYSHITETLYYIWSYTLDIR